MVASKKVGVKLPATGTPDSVDGMLTRVGVGVGEGLGDEEGVEVGLAVGDGDGVGEGVGDGVGLGVAVEPEGVDSKLSPSSAA